MVTVEKERKEKEKEGGEKKEKKHRKIKKQSILPIPSRRKGTSPFPPNSKSKVMSASAGDISLPQQEEILLIQREMEEQ